MNGAEHYCAAERLVESADEWLDADYGWKGQLSAEERIARRDSDLAAAQVHATLAAAAAAAWPVVDRYKGDSALTNAWSSAIGWDDTPTADDVVDAKIVDADDDSPQFVPLRWLATMDREWAGRHAALCEAVGLRENAGSAQLYERVRLYVDHADHAAVRRALGLRDEEPPF